MRQLTFWEEEIHQYPMPISKITEFSPTGEITAAFYKHYTKFREWNGDAGQYKRIMVSISGGSDSDILIDMIERIGYPQGAVHYVFFNTGLEFQATKDHIKYLENKYGVKIEERRAKITTAAACRKYGQPFLSKQISEWIQRLQLHNFQWEDEPYNILIKKYPKCFAALKWWCNEYGENSRLNIDRNKLLKEFLIENPPDFLISNKCCTYSKKKNAEQCVAEYNPDLDVQGIRKAEGGARAIAHKNCFDDIPFGCSKLRPIFWFSADDKTAYCDRFDVEHSRCYSEYGLTRTGCACCPYGRDFEKELLAAKKYEPNLYKAANFIFEKSYEYTRKYKEFVKKKKMEAIGL